MFVIYSALWSFVLVFIFYAGDFGVDLLSVDEGSFMLGLYLGLAVVLGLMTSDFVRLDDCKEKQKPPNGE